MSGKIKKIAMLVTNKSVLRVGEVNFTNSAIELIDSTQNMNIKKAKKSEKVMDRDRNERLCCVSIKRNCGKEVSENWSTKVCCIAISVLVG